MTLNSYRIIVLYSKLSLLKSTQSYFRRIVDTLNLHLETWVLIPFNYTVEVNGANCSGGTKLDPIKILDRFSILYQ